MPITTICWSWEEAFDKFGFGDGDGIVMTGSVAAVLRNAGYEVDVGPWGCHNVVIFDVRWRNKSLFPESVRKGYDDPRRYLPKRVVRLLDRSFPKNSDWPL